MAHTFISYSRADKAFVQKLDAALAARGRENWVDWKNIPPTAAWLEEVYTGIEQAEAVIFVISPASAKSVECGKELDYAVRHHKRLIPIVHRQVDPHDLPDSVASINWIYFQQADQFEEALETLIHSLETDLDWVRSHTRLLAKALEWERGQEDRSILLRGSDLDRAERWLTRESEGRKPEPTALQRQYILASRREAVRRQRLGSSAVALGLAAVILLLMLLFWQQRHAAQVFQASTFTERGMAALADYDAQSAEVLFAQSLTLDDRPDVRERLLEARVKSARLLWRRPGQPGNSVFAVSSNGRWCLFQQADGSVQVWDLEGAQECSVAAAPGAEIVSAAISSDGARLALGRRDGTITLWDNTDQRIQKTLQGQTDAIVSVAFSPDGRRLASGCRDNSVWLWSAAGGRLQWKMPGCRDQVACLAFSPDGMRLAAGSWDRAVHLWDTRTGKALALLMGHEEAVLSVAFSPDGSRLASGSWDTRILLWDIRRGVMERALLGHKGGVECLAFSPDGRRLASGADDGTARLWGLTTDRNMVTLTDHAETVTAVGFSADGRRLISGTDSGAAQIWDVAGIGDRAEVATLRGHRGPVAAACFAGSHVLVSAGWDRTLRLWDTAQDRESAPRVTAAHDIARLTVSPDGHLAATGGEDGTVSLWQVDSAGGTISLAATLRDPGHRPSAVWSLAFSPDRRFLAVGEEDSRIRLWAVATRQLKKCCLLPGNPKVFALTFSPDSQTLASGHQMGVIRLWDVRTGALRRTLTGHDGAVWGLAFSRDGRRLASGSEDGTLCLWDTATGNRRWSMNGQGGPIWSLAYSPDGRWIATAGQDAAVRLWDVETQQAMTFRCCLRPVSSVAFSPDGASLAAASADQMIRVWNLSAVRSVLEAPPPQMLAAAQQETGLGVTGRDLAYLPSLSRPALDAQSVPKKTKPVITRKIAQNDL